jgi:hypothetical protein
MGPFVMGPHVVAPYHEAVSLKDTKNEKSGTIFYLKYHAHLLWRQGPIASSGSPCVSAATVSIFFKYLSVSHPDLNPATWICNELALLDCESQIHMYLKTSYLLLKKK